MKRRSEPREIRNEDIESFLMWKVFRKLIRQETLFIFFLKVGLLAVFFVIFIFLINLIGTFSGN